MKKILIIALLFWGCDYAPTEHTHEHEHDTTHEHEDGENYPYSLTISFGDNCEGEFDKAEGTITQIGGGGWTSNEFSMRPEDELTFYLPALGAYRIYITMDIGIWDYTYDIVSTGITKKFTCGG